MKVMSLFAGIGGFDLAADWMDWATVVQVELNRWCRTILQKHFPNALRHGDIKTFDGQPYQGSIDLICGGFPCQPYSTAGKRLGKADERHLWPDMFRVIREVKPRWVVGENVSGFLNWNGGLVFNEVLTDLETEGYQVQAFVIPACSVNAPHKRDRVWIIAYRNDRFNIPSIEQLQSGWQAVGTSNNRALTYPNGEWQQQSERSFGEIGGWLDNGTQTALSDAPCVGWNGASTPEPRKHQGCQPLRGCDCSESITYSVGSGLRGETNRLGRSELTHKAGKGGNWSDWPTQSPLCSRNDGFPSGLVRSDRRRIRAVARWRAETIKAAGNAVVPQVVYQIFRAIESVELQLKQTFIS